MGLPRHVDAAVVRTAAVIDGEIHDHPVRADERARGIAVDVRTAVDWLWVRLAYRLDLRNDDRAVRPGHPLVRRADHRGTEAARLLVVLMRLDQEEAIDERAVRQDHDLIRDRLVLLTGVVDLPGRLPIRVGRRALGRAGEPGG